jgi:hypothetical protein
VVEVRERYPHQTGTSLARITAPLNLLATRGNR